MFVFPMKLSKILIGLVFAKFPFEPKHNKIIKEKIMFKIKNLFQGSMLLISALAISVGCSHKEYKTEGVSSDEKNPMTYTEREASKELNETAARKVDAHNFTEIQFKKGSAELTESAKASLAAVIDTASKSGEIDEVIVMSWADQEFPSNNLKKLSKSQRELANNRSNNISKYVKNIKWMDVDAYNMTEQPKIYSKWFNTTDYKLKNALVAAGLPTTADDPKYPAKSSKSVILVKIK